MRYKLLCAALVLTAALTGVASAQEQPATPTPTPTSTSTPTPTPTPESNATVAVNVGPLTDVMEWRYRGGTFRIVVRAEAPTLLTIAESPGESSGGAGSIRFVRQSLAPGRNIVTVNVPMSGGEAVVILSTPGSVRQGRAAFLRADSGGGLLDGPPSKDDVRDAALGGGLGTGLAALLVIVRRRFGLHRGMERVA